MLVSRKDLEKLVDLSDVSTEELCELYNNYGGLEVEEVTHIVPQNNYIVGKILAFAPHPAADKLNVCQVDLGHEVVEIVCGAPNVATDKYVLVATTGTTMPNGMTIEQREIRGVTSNGMLCSLQEIGLEEKYVDNRYKAGIFFFDDYDVTVGDDALAALGFDTDVIDVSITPDRADCLSYRGLAYETAALAKKAVAPETFTFTQPAGTFSIHEYVSSLEVTTEKVLDYHLIAFRNITIKPSPAWMQRFLIANGVRPISNVVDITNYVMLLLGLPLHAFDGAKLPENKVIVRQAHANETITTLDDKERKLTEEDIVITTGAVSIALAGVMGGANTEIDEHTNVVVLEAAIFNPTSVRKTAVKFDLRSDASQRFEKGVDPTLPKLALALTSQLMIDYADAEVSEDTVSMDFVAQENPRISCEYQKIAQRIGIPLSSDDINAVLARLNFTVEQVDTIKMLVTAPTWRRDIAIFEDIVEEVARVYGFEHLPNNLPIDMARPVYKTDKMHYLDYVHSQLQGLGLQETLTYTLGTTAQATLGQYQSTLEPVSILYPLSADRETLRTTTYYSMLEVLEYHANRSFDHGAFYEMTNVYGVGTYHQVLGFAGFGNIENQKLYDLELAVDFYLLKAWFEATLQYIPKESLRYERTQNPIFHPGIAADVYLEGTFLGTFGKINPQTAKAFDFHSEFYVGEINIDTLFELEMQYKNKTERYIPVSKFPSIARDIAFIMDETMPLQALTTTIYESLGTVCKDVNVFDIYVGSHIEAGKKSVALTITFSDAEKTLTNEYVSGLVEDLLAEVEADLAITVRK